VCHPFPWTALRIFLAVSDHLITHSSSYLMLWTARLRLSIKQDLRSRIHLDESIYGLSFTVRCHCSISSCRRHGHCNYRVFCLIPFFFLLLTSFPHWFINSFGIAALYGLVWWFGLNRPSHHWLVWLLPSIFDIWFFSINCIKF
jgi:hypothetical protein